MHLDDPLIASKYVAEFIFSYKRIHERTPTSKIVREFRRFLDTKNVSGDLPRYRYSIPLLDTIRSGYVVQKVRTSLVPSGNTTECVINFGIEN